MRMFLSLLMCLGVTVGFSQNVLTGTVLDSDSGEPIVGAVVSINNQEEAALTDKDGQFSISISAGEYALSISIEGYERFFVDLVAGGGDEDLGSIWMAPLGGGSSDDLLDIIQLDDTDLEDSGASGDVPSLLTASRDVFNNFAAFGLNVGRFRIRGYNQNEGVSYLNGAPVNELENGRVGWSYWGGLNDVLRARENSTSLGISGFSFGSLNGASNIDLRASSQWKQLRVSYAASNRSYRNRIMGTYSTGLTENGWAFSLSGSRRWAQEGYQEGTFYDAFSYFLSVDKVLSDQHSLNLVVLGAPLKRGRASGSVQEMYDIADDNYYNPNWGFQNGEKRNARVYDTHQPIGILRYDFTPSLSTRITATALYQTGKFGSTGLDWINAPDPRPDYYRNLPSAIENSEVAQEVRDRLSNDQASRQINWAALYEANQLNFQTINDVNGIPGNSESGLLANYIVQEQHFDLDRFSGNINVVSSLSDDFNFSGGVSYQNEVKHNYVEVKDLLGADFYLDFDRFAERDFPGNTDVLQNDLDNPNGLAREGDRIQYDYDINLEKYAAWSQFELRMAKFDVMGAVNLSQNSFWREGYRRNGKFPDSSFGKSEKHSFTNYQAKAGITYKINGRNYVYANGLVGTNAPFARQSFISPRTRDQVVSNLESSNDLSAELGYAARYSGVKGRITGFYTKKENYTQTRSFYHDELRSFVNIIYTDQDYLHTGLEAAFEAKLSSTISMTGLVALGRYTYASRPNLTISQDNNAELLNDHRNSVAYIDNYFQNSGPQTAYGLKLSYNSPKFWFANLSFSCYDDNYLDINPLRRTVAAADPVVKSEDPLLFNQIIAQEKLPADYSVDFFGGKSWKINDYFIYLNVGVNNILNNQNFITGGFEQSRFDFEGKDVDRFPPRYFYANGTTYFISLTFKI